MPLQGSPYTPFEYEYKPKLNGGLYTGEPFKKDAPWGNFPVKPETGSLINENLKSANPPPFAVFHYPGGEHRPGNNTPVLPGVKSCNGFNMIDFDTEGAPEAECSVYCPKIARTPKCWKN
jgi:hypothetical protein